MTGRHAICVSIDGLRASALGTYGNTTSRTPQLDDLASQSAVVEWLWADSPVYDSFFSAANDGVHALRNSEYRNKCTPLKEMLRQHDVPMRLITDDRSLHKQWSANCQESVLLDLSADGATEEIAETVFANFCSAAVDHLDQWLGDGAGSLTWIHSRGLFGSWDAPLQLRRELLDEEDPPALEFLEPPTEIRPVDDPDQLLLYRTAYAAQVSVIDACVGALWNAIEELMCDRETLLMLCGSRGFALGEHDAIGSQCTDLLSEQLHLPWLLRICDDQSLRQRIPALTHPADIHATLLDWLGIEPQAASDGRSLLPHLDGCPAAPHRKSVLAVAASEERTLLTHEWLLRRQPEGDPQLFAKPDDRWEHNDVARRCHAEVEQLEQVAKQWEQAAKDGLALP